VPHKQLNLISYGTLRLFKGSHIPYLQGAHPLDTNNKLHAVSHKDPVENSSSSFSPSLSWHHPHTRSDNSIPRHILCIYYPRRKRHANQPKL